TFGHPSHERLGVRIALPLLDRLTFYPAVEIEPEIACSQAFVDLRMQPLGTRGPGSLWYVGGGLVAARDHPRTDLFTGASDRPDRSGRLLKFTSLVISARLQSIYKWGSRSQSGSSLNARPAA